jgi:hypothetical protein
VEQEGDTVLIFGEYFGNGENRAKAQDKLRRSVASLERQQKILVIFHSFGEYFTKLKYSSSEKYANSCDIRFSSRSMKRREGVFSPKAQKNGMYVKFHAS